MRRGVNNIGTVVGEFIHGEQKAQGFRLSQGVFTALEAPAADAAECFAWGVNDADEIVATTPMHRARHMAFSGRLTTILLSMCRVPHTYAFGINKAG